MGKFDGILLCTDLDGTLLNGKREVSEENRNAIEYFKREGGRFTFVTGRMPYYSKDAYHQTAPNAPIGANNGSAVYDFMEAQYVWRKKIDERLGELISAIDEKLPHIGIILCGFEQAYLIKSSPIAECFLKNTHQPKQTCDYRHPPVPIAKTVLGIECEEDVAKIEQILLSHPLAVHFSFVRSERTLFEILPQGTHKGLALARIAEHLGIDLAHTVAVGDYDNDVGMLRTAGIGIAVANASSSARDAADYVTVSNEKHAIACIIRDIENRVYAL